jgi:hypothetical protein
MHYPKYVNGELNNMLKYDNKFNLGIISLSSRFYYV